MRALVKLLEDNADSSNTRCDMLTGDEVSAIVEALNAETVIDKMRKTYERGHPEAAEAGPQHREELTFGQNRFGLTWWRRGV